MTQQSVINNLTAASGDSGVIQLKHGRLAASIRNTSVVHNGSAVSKLLNSTDGGQTWNPVQTLAANTDSDFFIEDATGLYKLNTKFTGVANGTGVQIKATAVDGGGAVTTAIVNPGGHAGTGYVVGDPLPGIGGSGTNAAFTVATIGAGGAVGTVNIANPGSGYTVNNVLTTADVTSSVAIEQMLIGAENSKEKSRLIARIKDGQTDFSGGMLLFNDIRFSRGSNILLDTLGAASDGSKLGKGVFYIQPGNFYRVTTHYSYLADDGGGLAQLLGGLSGPSGYPTDDIMGATEYNAAAGSQSGFTSITVVKPVDRILINKIISSSHVAHAGVNLYGYQLTVYIEIEELGSGE